MNKITKEQLQDYVAEVGEFEKEHRKYSSFYCWSSHTMTEDDIKELANEGVDASEFLGVTVVLNGMWDDSGGSDWDEMTFSKQEAYQELVPEHYVTKYKSTDFVPKWE